MRGILVIKGWFTFFSEELPKFCSWHLFVFVRQIVIEAALLRGIRNSNVSASESRLLFKLYLLTFIVFQFFQIGLKIKIIFLIIQGSRLILFPTTKVNMQTEECKTPDFGSVIRNDHRTIRLDALVNGYFDQQSKPDLQIKSNLLSHY